MQTDHFQIITSGTSLLKNEKNYAQATIVNKLKYLKYDVSESTFSNIINRKKTGKVAIIKTSEGIQKLVKAELGLKWKNGVFVKPDEGSLVLQEIPSLSIKEPSLILKPGFVFREEGRFTLDQKMEFLSSSKEEVIEFGLTLRTYSSNFYSRNDIEFKIPIIKLLEKGVNFKCFVLDPESNEARLYFEDRGKIIPEEKKGVEVIKRSIEKLGKVQTELNKLGNKGRFEVFTYKHIPSNYFMAIDVNNPRGKIAVSHYIYGEFRAKCPVIEFTKEHNPSLYRRYATSLNNLIKDAKLIAFS